MLSKNFVKNIIVIERYFIEYYCIQRIFHEVSLIEHFSIQNCCCGKILYRKLLLSKDFLLKITVIEKYFIRNYCYRFFFFFLGKIFVIKKSSINIIIVIEQFFIENNYRYRTIFYRK